MVRPRGWAPDNEIIVLMSRGVTWSCSCEWRHWNQQHLSRIQRPFDHMLHCQMHNFARQFLDATHVQKLRSRSHVSKAITTGYPAGLPKQEAILILWTEFWKDVFSSFRYHCNVTPQKFSQALMRSLSRPQTSFIGHTIQIYFGWRTWFIGGWTGVVTWQPDWYPFGKAGPIPCRERLPLENSKRFWNRSVALTSERLLSHGNCACACSPRPEMFCERVGQKLPKTLHKHVLGFVQACPCARGNLSMSWPKIFLLMTPPPASHQKRKKQQILTGKNLSFWHTRTPHFQGQPSWGPATPAMPVALAKSRTHPHVETRIVSRDGHWRW